jgi:hypothetical protein
MTYRDGAEDLFLHDPCIVRDLRKCRVGDKVPSGGHGIIPVRQHTDTRRLCMLDILHNPFPLLPADDRAFGRPTGQGAASTSSLSAADTDASCSPVVGFSTSSRASRVAGWNLLLMKRPVLMQMGRP